MDPKEFEVVNTGSQQQNNPADFEQHQEDLPWYKNLTRTLWQEAAPSKIVSSGFLLDRQLRALGNDVAGMVTGDQKFKDRTAQLDKEIDDIKSQGVDYGTWGGKVKPIDGPLDAISQGAKAASFIVPEAEGAQLVTKPKFLGSMVNWMAEKAPFVLTQALGTATGEAAKGKSAGDVTKDTLMDIGANYLTLGLFKGGGSLLKMGGGALIKNPVVTAIAEQTTKLADDMYSAFGEARQATARELGAWTTKFNQIHRDATKALGDSLTDKEIPDMTWDAFRRKVGDVLKRAYDTSANNYSDVYRPDLFIKPDVGSALNKEITGALQKYNVPEELAQKYMESAGTTGAPVREGVLSNLLNEIKTIQYKNKGQIPFSDINALWRDYGMGSANKAENQSIKNILMSLNKDARATLNLSDETKPLLERWDQANELWSNISGGLNGKFTSLLKVAANPKDFVDSIFTKNPKELSENIRLLVDGLGKEMQGLDDQSRQFLSRTIRNNVIDSAVNYSRVPTEGGDKLTKFLDLWEPKGILHPEDVNVLDKLANFMKGTYDDFANELQSATEIGNKMTDLTDAGKIVQKTQGASDVIEGAFKSVQNKPLYRMNADGTYDFSNFSKFVDKLNETGKFDNVVNEIKKYDDLSKVPQSKLASFVRVLVGSSIAASGHPVFGGGYAIRGLEGLVGKTSEKITEKDVQNVLTDMLKKGDVNGFQKVLMQLVSGGKDKSGAFLGRMGTLTVDAFLGAARSMKGGDLTPEEEAELRNEFELIKTPHD